MQTARRWQLTVDHGVTLAGDEQGHPDAPAVLLLHGAASNRRWWDLVAARLAVGHRVIRYDHRGHGRSTSSSRDCTVDRLAADAIAVLEGLGLDRVVLAGHSAGASVALTVAADRPDLVARLACVDGGVYDLRLMFGHTWAQARQAMLVARRGRTTSRVLRAWLTAAGLPSDLLPIVAANYRVASAAGDLRLRLEARHEEHLAYSLWAQDPSRTLPAVHAPVLVVAAQHGDDHHDRPRSESIRRARELLGDRLQVCWLPGGHDLPLQRPAAVAEALAGLTALVESPA